MSRSQPSIQSPSTKFFEWSGDKGALSYWNQFEQPNEAGAKGERVSVSFPFAFLVLDELATIKGFSDADQCGYWSNEVRSTVKEPLTVRTKHGIKEVGIYKELKVLSKGAKYAKSVYMAYYDSDGEDKQLVIGNIKFVGASLSAWIDFSGKNRIGQGCVILTGRGEMETKGKTEFYRPAFKYNPKVSDEAEQTAQKLDSELQTYLKAYFALQGEESKETAEQSNEDYIDQRNRELDDYEPEKAQAATANEFGAGLGDNDYSNPSDLDIPF